MAKAKKKAAAKKRGGGGHIVSRGRVAVLPQKAKGNAHNGPPKSGMSDDEKIAAIAKADRLHAAFQKAKKEADSANSTYRNYLKEVDKKGFDKKAYIAARELDKDDHGTVQVHFANVGEQLRLRESNLATSMSLFQDIELPEVDDEAPAVKGLRAGRGGFARTSNPYPPGSEDYQSYDNNWVAGQTEIAEGMRPGEATH